MNCNVTFGLEELEVLVAKSMAKRIGDATQHFLASAGFNAHFICCVESAMIKALDKYDFTPIIEEVVREEFRKYLMKNSDDLKLFTDFYKKAEL